MNASEPTGRIVRSRMPFRRTTALRSEEVVRPTSQLAAVSGATAPAAFEGAIPLSRPRIDADRVPNREGRGGVSGGMLITVLSSLAIVLSVFFLVLWAMRRAVPAGLAVLPNEVIESLGRAPLNARQQMQLIRLGNRLLLLSVTPQGAETLAEITDRSEVDRLAGLCHQNRAGSASATFRQVLTQFASEPTPAGFVGDASHRTAGV